MKEELAIDANAAAFSQHELNMDDYHRAGEAVFDFTVWLKEAKNQQNKLQQLVKLSEEKDRLQIEHEQKQRQSSEKKQQLDEHLKELKHLQSWFEDVHQQLEYMIFQWMEDRPKLYYSDEARQEIARKVQGLYGRSRFAEVRDLLDDAIFSYQSNILAEFTAVNHEKKFKLQEIEHTKAELNRIKTQKMLEPERAPGTEQHRERLLAEGKAFVPFYAAVEFREDVTEEQKERIESALKQTGFLDSLITNEAIKPKEDRVLEANPRPHGFTLADYLMPDLEEASPILYERVDEVLRSISLEADESGFHLDVDGTYSLGCLHGHAPMEDKSKYIGRTARKRHQREQIQRWTEKLNELYEELNEIEDRLKVLELERQLADNWKKELPHDKDLAELYEQIEQKQRFISNEQQLLQTIDEQWKKVYEKLEAIKRQLREKGGILNIALHTDSLSEAAEAAESYIEFLHELKDSAKDIVYSKAELARIKQDIAGLEAELDELKGEQLIKQTRLTETEKLIASIEKQLQLQGIEQIRSRIQQVQTQLAEAEARLAEIRDALPQKKADANALSEKLAVAEADMEFWKKLAAEWEQAVKVEIHRGFWVEEDPDPKAIFNKYAAIMENNDRSKLLELLSKTFINEQQHLAEYRMFEYSEELEAPDWFAEVDAVHEPFMTEWKLLKSRKLIQLEYKGQRVSPYYIASVLEKELLEQQNWLDEQDRQLYEEIIVNSVGTILRARIQRAQAWVKQMDKIMAERDNSSGLIFSIAWKPLTAESEQELDTVQLVKLLQRDSKFLSEDDLQAITKHFQSRISKAKEMIQLRNEGSTLHQVLKEVLDYRKWFTFVLSYRRVNEPKRELTNNAFFQFSGGEKAMAMYIPLFTAAYSRYKEAGASAPFIISLDEAFAGVDENNIRDMFEVVEQLGFNYIMNSQALWGDYDTVSSLAIAELVRPKNADFVTVIRYQWDGMHKSLVVDEELMTSE